jgi:hypothetical protein
MAVVFSSSVTVMVVAGDFHPNFPIISLHFTLLPLAIQLLSLTRTEYLMCGHLPLYSNAIISQCKCIINTAGGKCALSLTELLCTLQVAVCLAAGCVAGCCCAQLLCGSPARIKHTARVIHLLESSLQHKKEYAGWPRRTRGIGKACCH